MINTILMMYITLIPPILAGIVNMIWCKIGVLKTLSVPMDFNKNFIDGKRIFGDNKTWKGFIGYILFNIIFAVIWGLICNISNINHLNYFYVNNDNNLVFNLLIGLLLGLGYGLFELPNSFIKRRIGIKEGKGATGVSKVIFTFIDQADSVIGCALVVWLFYNLGIKLFLLYIVIGAGTHIIINMMLYFLKLRKNMF